jgi:hypothetical protein
MCNSGLEGRKWAMKVENIGLSLGWPPKNLIIAPPLHIICPIYLKGSPIIKLVKREGVNRSFLV